MKKFAIIIALVVVAVSGVSAQVSVAGQTLYYRYVETVDPNTGMRSMDRDTSLRSASGSLVPKEVYITFTRNSCYTSDEKGMSKHYSNMSSSYRNNPFSYQGEQNNMFVFRAYEKSSTVEVSCYFYFSKDYKRINFRRSASVYPSWEQLYKQNIYIYEQADPPQPQPVGPQPPVQMW